MNAPVVPKRKMNVSEFFAWAEMQPHGRYELVDGEVVAMSPERVRHNLVKAAVLRTLENAVQAAKLPCIVFTDGVSVVINDHLSREPDASVQCGVEVDLDSMAIDAPVIVVEIVSPSSGRADTNLKLVEYFSVPSILHYLIVMPERGAVVHHQRSEDAAVRTHIAREGEILLDPPGFTVAVDALLGPAAGGGRP